MNRPERFVYLNLSRHSGTRERLISEISFDCLDFQLSRPKQASVVVLKIVVEWYPMPGELGRLSSPTFLR